MTTTWQPSQSGDHFRATLMPRTQTDLRPEVAEFVGRQFVWVASWKISPEDGGPYVGQYACHAFEPLELGISRFPWWVPFEDLTDVEPMRFDETQGKCV